MKSIINGLFFLSLLLAAFTGCAVNKSYVGDTTNQTKKNILRSPLFFTSDIFYPDGMRENFSDLPPVLNIEKVEVAQRYLQRLLNQIIERHNQRNEKLSQYLSHPLSPVDNIQIVLTNTGHPLIHTEVNHELVVDLRILHALFLSTVGSGIADEYVGIRDFFYYPSYDFSQLQDVDTKLSVRKGLVEFLDFKATVEDSVSYPVIIDSIVLFTDALFIDSASDWTSSKFTDYASITAETEERFIGSLIFLLAHEVGHVALGHFAESCQAADQAKFEKMELSADRYAAALLADSWDETKLFGDQARVTLNMRGNELFFLLSEKLAGFKEGPVREGFLYPSNDVRLENTRKTYDKVFIERRKELGYRQVHTLFGSFWTKEPPVERENAQ